MKKKEKKKKARIENNKIKSKIIEINCFNLTY